jgi:acetyl esterase/lipase
MKLFALAVLLATSLPLSAADAPAKIPVVETRSDGPGNIEIIRDREIAKVGGEPILVDLAYPKTPPAAPMPALLCVHGGGWSGGNKKDALALDAAIHGYFVVSVGYRLAGPAHWPAQIQDCKLALRWMRAHAADFHLDPEHIGCTGHSAGGHLVACLGTMGEVAAYDVGEYPGVSSRVQAVVDLAGPTDLTVYFKGKAGPIEKLFGPASQEHPEVLAEASPALHVQAGDPPFFIAHGDQDKLVPIAQAEQMVEALKKAGIAVEYSVTKNGGHGLGGGNETEAQPSRKELNEMILKFLDRELKK